MHSKLYRKTRQDEVLSKNQKQHEQQKFHFSVLKMLQIVDQKKCCKYARQKQPLHSDGKFE